MREKYNPIYHGQIVDNLMRAYEHRFKESTKLSKERIFELFQECFFDEDADDSTLEAMWEEAT